MNNTSKDIIISDIEKVTQAKTAVTQTVSYISQQYKWNNYMNICNMSNDFCKRLQLVFQLSMQQDFVSLLFIESHLFFLVRVPIRCFLFTTNTTKTEIRCSQTITNYKNEKLWKSIAIQREGSLRINKMNGSYPSYFGLEKDSLNDVFKLIPC